MFLPGVAADEPIELPKEEVDKFRKVLRLEQGDEIAVLPNDGTLIRCQFQGRSAVPVSVETPATEPSRRLTLIQALPKGDRLDTIIRMGTEIGVSEFVLFPAIRSVVKWDAAKVQEKLRRLSAVARESAEQSYRTRLPEIRFVVSLSDALKEFPETLVLSELESESKSFVEYAAKAGANVALCIGPEGGWDPKEVLLIGERGFSLGALVLRTDTAAAVACALAIYSV